MKNRVYNEQKPNQINEEKCIDFFSKLLEDKDTKITVMSQKMNILQAKEGEY